MRDSRGYRPKLSKREDQRALDEAMDQEPVGVRVDVGNAAMRTLEMHAIRRNHAVEQMMRRACRAGPGGPGQRRSNVRATLLFEFGRLAVADEPRPRQLHPRLDR